MPFLSSIRAAGGFGQCDAHGCRPRRTVLDAGGPGGCDRHTPAEQAQFTLD